MRTFKQLVTAIREDFDADAWQEMSQCADSSWLPQLNELLLKGESFWEREAVAEPIARMEGVSALPKLLGAMRAAEREGHDNDGLSNVVLELVETHPTESLGLLVLMAHSPDIKVREQAAWLLGFVSKESGPDLVIALACDPDASVRSAAVGSLSGFGERSEVFDALLAALNDISPQVKTSAINALGYYKDARAISCLESMRNDPTILRDDILEAAIQKLKNL